MKSMILLYSYLFIYGILADISIPSISVDVDNNRSRTLLSAFKLLDAMQHNSNCSEPGIKYGVVTMGIGGGFAAHFQLAASDWTRAAAGVKFQMPILILGQIKGYSTGEDCEKHKGEWTCYFLPLSDCQQELIATGTRVNFQEAPKGASLVPKVCIVELKYNRNILFLQLITKCSCFYFITRNSSIWDSHGGGAPYRSMIQIPC